MRDNFASTGAASIAYYLQKDIECFRKWKLRWKPVCSSTEREISRWLYLDPISHDESRAIISSTQRFGRGQYGRTWVSPKGGVWLSAAMPVCQSLLISSDLFGLLIAFSLAQRLEEKGLEVKIKWPNDLLINGLKLAGFLPKMIYRGNNLRLIKLGVGLNVSNPVPFGGISLSQIFGKRSLNKDKWTVEVLMAIDKSMRSLYKRMNLLMEVEKRLWATEVKDPKTGLIWTVRGIDSTGGLALYRNNENIVWSRSVP